MVLHLEFLKLVNFKTYSDSNFTFTPGHNVILGENGAGKSSIFEAISFALFGSVPGKKISSLIRHDQKRMEVTLDFSIDSEYYRVERIVTPSSSTALLMEKYGRRMAEKSKTVNEEIEKKLGVGQRVFSNVIYIPQGQIAAIASERPSDRRELFDKILGYYLYQKARERLRVVEKSAEQSKESTIKRIDDFKEDIKQKDRLENELKELENVMVVLQKELVELEPDLRNNYEMFKEMNQDREKINQIEERVKTQVNDIQNRQDKLTTTIESIKKQLKKSIPSSKKGILELKIEMEIKLKNLEESIKKTEISVEIGKKIENTMTELNKTKDSIRNQVDKIENKIKQFNSRSNPNKGLIVLKKEISKLNSHKRELETSLKAEIDKDKQQGIIAENMKLIVSENEKIDDKIKKCETFISEILPKWKRKLPLLLKRNFSRERMVLRSEIREKQEKLIEFQSSIKSVTNQIENERKIIMTLKTSKKKSCPLCGQKVYKSHIDMIKKEKEEFISRKTGEITNLENDKEDLTNAIEMLENNRKNIVENEKQQISLQKFSDDLKAFLTQVSANKKKINQLKIQLEKLGETGNKIIRIEEKIARNEKKFLEANEQVNIHENIGLLKDQMKDVDNRLNEVITEINDKEDDFNFIELERNVNVLNIQKEDQRMLLSSIPRLESIITEREALEKAIEFKNENLITLKSIKKDFDEEIFERIRNKVENLKTKKIEKETQIKSIKRNQIPDKQKQIKEIIKKEKRLKKLNIELKIAEHKLSTVNLVRSFTKEIVPLLRRQHVMAISEYSSEIFSYLLDNEEYEGIDITDDYELLVQQSGKKHDLTILSGGEQVIACLAIRLAIAKMLANQDIMLLDEPTVMLDSYRRKELVEVFDKTKPVRQTIIVTHDTEFERVADTTFTIVKRAGRARVIAEEVDHIISQQKKYQTLTQERFSQLEI